MDQTPWRRSLDGSTDECPIEPREYGDGMVSSLGEMGPWSRESNSEDQGGNDGLHRIYRSPGSDRCGNMKGDLRSQILLRPGRESAKMGGSGLVEVHVKLEHKLQEASGIQSMRLREGWVTKSGYDGMNLKRGPRQVCSIATAVYR